MAAGRGEVTAKLQDLSAGDPEAPAYLMPLVYDELRRLADRYMKEERPDHTLQATALVHEAYLELVDQRNVTWQNRAHFFGLAAQLMRRILTEHARKHGAAKRGGSLQKLSLDEAVSYPQERDFDLIALDDALSSLEEVHPLRSRIIELRFFGGLSVEETAEVLSISASSVKRQWTIARAWLRRQIDRTGKRV